ncbi:FUT7 [Branchiostoma lanceolatum]|uniref:Fucosyltransferase n=1 Tax=Branchiostoma lanceolatum TaxID=7740 RepID=A0A8K0EG91_BRALA|nr:FUT7 [Branchiostoma lanceolatum]
MEPKNGYNKHGLFKTVGAFMGMCVYMYLLYIVYDEYTMENPMTLHPSGEPEFNRSKGLHDVDENASLIQRSVLPRYHYFISSLSAENTSSKFYSVWHEEATLPLRKSLNSKIIVVWNSTPKWPPKSPCSSMPQCVFSKDRRQVADADAVLFRGIHGFPLVYNRTEFPTVRPSHQYWIYMPYECPHLTRDIDLVSYGGVFNWTFTYRNDSDILATWGHVTQIYQELAENPPALNRDYAEHKTKLVLWYVSNCYKHLSRFAYVTELRKHIQVDIFGRCGNASHCGKKDRQCFIEHIRQYKFYLAFENFKCAEYITEKFWDNSLKNDVVPIVLGAPKDDYERFAPPNSFIHVDDFNSPRELANYLEYLDQNDHEYNQYFAWKTEPPKNLPVSWEGRYCEVCKKLLKTSPTERKVYTDLDRWWRGENYELCEPLIYDGSYKHPKNAIHFH